MISSKPLGREPAGASTESVSVPVDRKLRDAGAAPAASTPRPHRSSLRPPADPSPSPCRKACAADTGGKCFSRAISSFSAWFSTRCPAKAALSFSFSPRNRSTSPTNRRTKPTNSVGVMRSSKSIEPSDMPGFNQAFVNAPFPAREFAPVTSFLQRCNAVVLDSSIPRGFAAPFLPALWAFGGIHAPQGSKSVYTLISRVSNPSAAFTNVQSQGAGNVQSRFAWSEPSTGARAFASQFLSVLCGEIFHHKGHEGARSQTRT